MSAFELVLVGFGAVLAAAALVVVYRMIVGPTILDRALATDSLVTLAVMGMALYAAQSDEIWAGPAMLGLTGLAFIGTVTFARFVAREDPRQGALQHRADEPATDTALHEAIHPHPSTSPSSEEAPENRFVPEEADLSTVDEDPDEDPEHPGEPLEEPVTSSFGDEGHPRWPEETGPAPAGYEGRGQAPAGHEGRGQGSAEPTEGDR